MEPADLTFDDAPSARATPVAAFDLVASRAKAVDRIYRGGVGGLAGAGLFFAAANGAFGLATFGFSLALAGLLLTGVGFGTMGLAARHLERFGGGDGSRILLACGGLGASLATYAGTLAIGWFAELPGVARGLLGTMGALGVLGCWVVLTVLVLRVVLRWAAADEG